MRAPLILAAVASLPVLVLAHKQYVFPQQQAALREAVLAALADPKFGGIEKARLTMNYLDVSLDGTVADPEARREAQERIAAVRGVRCRDEDNHLMIPAHLSSKLADERLELSGWLRDERVVASLCRWLESSRPGLQVDATRVRTSPYVTVVDVPDAKVVPAILNETWNSLRVKATLKIEKDAGRIRVSGALPSAPLRTAVVEALLGTVAQDGLDARQLRAGGFVKPARFAEVDALPAFLRRFFGTPEATLFETDGDSVKIKGSATPAMEQEWRGFLQQMVERHKIAADVLLFPTPLMFPKYQPASKLSPAALNALRLALNSSAIAFASGEFTLPQEQRPKIASVLQALLAAGSEALVVVAAHVDAAGNAEENVIAAKRRVDLVLDELKMRGAPAKQLEGMVLPLCPTLDGSDVSRTVVFLVK